MKEYKFYSIAEVRIVDDDKETVITVRDDRLDELRPLSQVISRAQNILEEINPPRAQRPATEAYWRLQGMIEVYVAAMMSGGFETAIYRK